MPASQVRQRQHRNRLAAKLSLPIYSCIITALELCLGAVIVCLEGFMIKLTHFTTGGG